jgi:hypothetical protein
MPSGPPPEELAVLRDADPSLVSDGNASRVALLVAPKAAASTGARPVRRERGGYSTELEWSQMLSITGGESSALEAAICEWGAEAVVRPGVDGDIAGLLATDEIVKKRAVASFRDAAFSHGFDMRILSESEFAEVLAE